MDITDLVSALLRGAADEPRCDRCIAVTLRETLTAVRRALPIVLDSSNDYARRATRCTACGESTVTVVYAPAVKCTRCSRTVAPPDGISEHGDVFHHHCWDVLRSELRIANSRQLARLSREVVRRSRERLDGNGQDPPAC